MQLLYYYTLMIQFQEIYQLLPKTSLQWDVSEVAIWLNVLGMSPLVEKFKSLMIDGHKLANINQQFIIRELKISSRIYVKKLIQWTEIQRTSYDEYVQKSSKDNQSKISTPVSQYPMIEPNQGSSDIKIQNSKFIQSKLILQVAQQSINPKKQVQGKPVIIIAYDSKEHIVTQTTSIGRQPSKKIFINQDSVSRTHANILKINNEYFIVNQGKYGTFIELENKTEVWQGITILLGNTELTIKNIKLSKSTFDVTFKIDDEGKPSHDFKIRNQIVFGKRSRDINLNDGLLANNHAKLQLSDGKLYLERLESNLIYRKLADKEHFRLGNLKIKMGTVVLHSKLGYICQECQKCNQYKVNCNLVCGGCLNSVFLN